MLVIVFMVQNNINRIIISDIIQDKITNFGTAF